MKSAFKSFQIFLLLCGVFGADEDEVKSVMEGDSVTLNPDLTQIKKFNLIQWRFGGSVIAKHDGNEIKYYNHTEIFRDRLQLDQTGSLTIRNMRTKHSGLYKAEISHSTGTSPMKFNVSVHESPSVIAAGVTEIKRLPLKEGDPVTLHVPQIQGDELIVWRFGDEGKLIAKHDIEAKSSSLYDETDERFRDRLKLDQTGSLTITNTRITDSGFYSAKISSNKLTLSQQYVVTISVPDSGLSPGAVAGIVLVLLLAAAVAVAAGAIYYRRKISEIQKQTYSIIPETVKFEEGGFVSLSSGVTKIQEGDQMLWTFEDETIATMSKKDKKTTYYYDRKRFRGRLQLDPQTGSLIIRNLRKTDSGLYQLQIKSKGETTSYRKYQVTVRGEVTTMRVKEKDNVTLKIDLQLKRGDDMKWWFRNEMCIASLRKKDEGFKCIHLAGGKFKDRLELDKTGSLTIKNFRPEHIGFYEVKTERRGMKFSVISDDIQTGHDAGQGVFIEKDEMKTVSVKEGGTLKLSTDTEIQADDEMILMFGSKKRPYEIIARFSLKDQDVFITVSKMLTKRLKLDHTGFLTITITSITFSDCGDYYVQITNKRNERFKSFTFTVVPDGVFSGDEVKSVSAIEGYSVTLNSDLTQIQKDDLIVWTSGHEGKLIAKSDEKKFRDGLKLDHQTGSLTITNIRTTDSGLYELQIIRNTQMMFRRFMLTVHYAEVIMSVKKGESVTLKNDRSEIQSNDLILWKFKDMILAKNKELCSERDGLELDKKTGSLTIRNITSTDCGYYILQIINGERTMSKRFNVTLKALSFNEFYDEKRHDASPSHRPLLSLSYDDINRFKV